jgi:hypothetical protein
VSKNDAERARAYYQRNRSGAVSVTDVEVSANAVGTFVMWGYVPNDVSQRPKLERKALIKQAVNRFLNEDLQNLREPPAPPAGGKPLAGSKTEELSR